MGSKIAILGAAYKKDINDVRESSIFRIYESLDNLGAEITVYDPHVNSFRLNGNDIEVTDVDYSKLGSYFDTVVLLTEHASFDYEKIALTANTIFDTKNGFKNINTFKGNYYKL
jgi:UDP-N-acetyl-D-glucosamine dehydrogenase